MPTFNLTSSNDIFPSGQPGWNNTGDDIVNGLDGDDSIIGGNGDDILNGDAGYDYLNGGDGNDVLNTGTGSGASYGGDGDDEINGSEGNDDLYGGAGNDTIRGMASLYPSGDTIFGDEGNDWIETGSGGGFAWGGAGDDNLIGGAGKDYLFDDMDGDIGNDGINGGGGNDILYSNAGSDIIDGGDGIDELIFNRSLTTADLTLDIVSLSTAATVVGDGSSLVNVENITFYCGSGINKISLFSGSNRVEGGDGNDILSGGSGQDFFRGGLGVDTLRGNGGDDTLIGTGDFYGGDGGDLLYLSNSYTSNAGTAHGGAGNDSLACAIDGYGVVTMYGEAGNDSLEGGRSADYLDGGAGIDRMKGGDGDDIYVVDRALDTIDEFYYTGNDTVLAFATYTLGYHLEDLEMRGSANIGGTGNDNNNRITGNGGFNTLNGLYGADTMSGLGGNDTYYVDNAGDTVTEALNEGIDSVYSSISIALSADVEKLYLTGTAAGGTGNSLSNHIHGNALANTLNGGAGADRMFGGDGSDIYVVDSTGDLVFETSAASVGGVDQVRSAVNFTLGANIERLLLTGGANANGAGNGINNTMTGNAGNNFIDGKMGNDTLTGGLGNDHFLFSTALAASNIDTIADFSVSNDMIRLENAIFAGLVAGYLQASAFVIGAAAVDGSDRIVYNSTTGALLFDADGNGAGAAKQFATLGTGLALTASDFYVF